MKILALLGFGGHGKVVADAALEAGWDLIRFYDDAPRNGHLETGWVFGGSTQSMVEQKNDLSGVFVSVGANKSRLQLLDAISSVGIPLVSVIHPKATISRFVSIGEGSVVCAGAIVNVHSKIGHGVIINTGATVDHDCVLGDGVHVSPGAHLAGSVHVGKRSWIGIGAVIKQGIVIGDDCIIGAGAVVLNNVESGLTVVGLPAKPLIKTK